jgi:hypothetical protein
MVGNREVASPKMRASPTMLLEKYQRIAVYTAPSARVKLCICDDDPRGLELPPARLLSAARNYLLHKSEISATLFLLTRSRPRNRAPDEQERMRNAFETFCTQPETRVDFFIFLLVTH